MKKLFMAFCLLFSITVSKAQYVSIPWPMDGTLASRYPGCMNGSMLDTTCLAIVNEDTLILTGYTEWYDAYFLRYFKNLRYLDVSGNELGGIYINSPFLETLICGRQSQDITTNYDGFYMGGSLHNIPQLPASLRVLDIRNSSISAWPSSWPPNLESLNISSCNLNALPTLPPGLKKLDCSRQTAVTSGGVGSSYANLILDTIISLPATLEYLNCSYTSITALPFLPSTLKYLDCSHTNWYLELCTTGQCVPFTYRINNGISSLPNWPPNLEYLDVSENHFPPHPANLYPFILPNIVPPTIIDLSVDSVSPATILPAGLLYFESGQRTKCLPRLPASLGGHSPYRSIPYSLVVQNSNLCLPNTVPGLVTGIKSDTHFNPPIVYGSITIPYCNVLNNTNNCASDPSITGYAFYDLNSNGIWDVSENPKEGLKVINDNGVIGFSGINGQYAAQGHLGNNVTTIIPPAFYDAVPSSINHTLNTADTVVIDTIALQPNIIIDSMRVTITPMGPARRGSWLLYHIKYENVGTTTVNANIVVNYNSSLLTVAGPINLSLNNVAPGQHGENTAHFDVAPSAPFGAEVHTTATITAGTSVCTDHSYLYVIFSLDPNDKHATPTLTAEQVNTGEFIDYLVRFQNVGTDTAFNITITDKLDPNLIANTLQVIEASHICLTTQINNYVNFKFPNIQLPDSNVNEPASHGYVRFRIKPQQGLPNNTNVPNGAAIYFDFNSPVITNDAITIVNFATVPLTLLDFSGMLQPENKVLLSWKTANEMNTARYDIEQGNDGRKFEAVAMVPAVGRGDNNYSKTVFSLPDGIVYYRLKITDIDGRSSYSNVIRISGGKNKAGFVLLNNPVRNEININLLDNSLVNTNATIINSQGIIVKTFTLTGGIQHINVSNLATGLYFIRTKNGTEKIVISK